MVRLYNQYTALALMSDVAVSVLLSADGTEIELLPIKPRPDEHEVQSVLDKWAGCGLRHVGVLGLVNGIAHSQLESALPDSVTLAIAQAFAVHVNRVRSESSAGDAIAWCEALYNLEDPRPYPHA